MADASTAVDVIGADHRAGELLHHIVGFIAGPARGTGVHDGAGTVLLFNLLQPLCGVADRFIPTDGLKLAAFLPPNQRLAQARGQQFGVVQEVPAVIAFQTQFTLIGHAVSRLGANDFAVIDHQFHFAACTAVRADGCDFFHRFSS
ncbi:hypothetical protein D3C76_1301490 [compost metagenome]